MARKGWRTSRRIFPIRYVSDYINVYQGPNRDSLAVLHKTVRTVRGRRDQKEPVENNTFMKRIPPTRGRVEEVWFDEENGIFRKAEPTPLEDKRRNSAKTERIVKSYLKAGKSWLMTSDHNRLVRLWQTENGSKWGIDTMHHFKIYVDPQFGSMKLFFGGKDFRFVEEIGAKGFLSIAYRNKQQAMDHLMMGSIRWVGEVFILPA